MGERKINPFHRTPAVIKSHHCRDYEVEAQGPAKRSRMDLGLALLSRVAVPGVCYTQEEIAAWAGCSRSMIYNLEHQALRKLRKRLRYLKPAEGADLFAAFFDRLRSADSRQGTQI